VYEDLLSWVGHVVDAFEDMQRQNQDER
jgi:hypothetical protein